MTSVIRLIACSGAKTFARIYDVLLHDRFRKIQQREASESYSGSRSKDAQHSVVIFKLFAAGKFLELCRVRPCFVGDTDKGGDRGQERSAGGAVDEDMVLIRGVGCYTFDPPENVLFCDGV